MLTSQSGPVVASAYGLGEDGVLSGPSRGEQGQVWRLDTARGTFAVKETFGALPVEEADASAVFQDHLSAHGAPLPRLVRDERGAHLREIDGATVRMYEWVDLAAPDSGLDPVAVGTALARIHRATFPASGPTHPWHTEPLGKGRWLELVRSCEKRKAPFADRLADVVDDLIAVERILRPMAPLQTCHLDLWADNFRQTAAGEICVIDWDNSGPAEPRREVAMVLFEFGRRDRSRLTELQAAYADAGGPAPVREPADFSVAVAQFGHIAERHISMWLAPGATDAVKDHATKGVEEIVDDLLDLETIDLILDALH